MEELCGKDDCGRVWPLKVINNGQGVGSLVEPDTDNANIVIASTETEVIIPAPGEQKRIRIVNLDLMSESNISIELLSGSTTMRSYKNFYILEKIFYTHLICGVNESFSLKSATADEICGGVQYIVEEIYLENIA
jgi:hypothetical protein